tara:strand:- start:2770 stop:3765 length:996 start_codon:yes stop_codon:yes gene_type:complete
MSYEIQEFRLPAAELEEVADFLADFVGDGELPDGSELDANPAVWSKRLSHWWTSNPFSRVDTPLGFVLRLQETNQIVGFQGFIPQDYVKGGEVIPGLISTTFFVRESQRSAALGMMMRLKRLSQRFHLVDGTPSGEVRAILDRLGFQKTGTGAQRYRIVPLVRLATLGRRENLQGFHVVLDPMEARSIPTPETSKLQKHVTREGLAWFIRSGSQPLCFAGLCDDSGRLCAYFIANTKSKFGLLSARVMESASFDADGAGLLRLANFASREPGQCGLPPKTSVVAWTSLNGGFRPDWLIRRSWSTHLYHLSPSSLRDTEKVAQPSEGDSMLL